MSLDPNIRRKSTTLKPPAYSKLSVRREVNFMWRQYSKHRESLQAPLPLSIVEHLQKQALTGGPVPKTAAHVKLESQLKQRRCETGQYQGKFHKIGSRFLRRQYQKFLGQYIPIMSQEDGKWKVDQVTFQKPDSFPSVPPQHMDGYVTASGVR
jgi:hypothetical protein